MYDCGCTVPLVDLRPYQESAQSQLIKTIQPRSESNVARLSAVEHGHLTGRQGWSTTEATDLLIVAAQLLVARR